MTMAVMMQPISRVIAIATRLATKIEAPNCWSWTAPTNARISPIRKLIRLTMPRARTAFLHDQEEIGDTKPRAPAHQGAKGEQALTEEAESDRHRARRRDRVGADPRKP